MTKWVKPSGLEVELNDEDFTIKKAVALGWKLVKAPNEGTAETLIEEPVKPKRGRPFKKKDS